MFLCRGRGPILNQHEKGLEHFGFEVNGLSVPQQSLWKAAALSPLGSISISATNDTSLVGTRSEG